MNHIFFCVNNSWIKQCGITIKSILFYKSLPKISHFIFWEKKSVLKTNL